MSYDLIILAFDPDWADAESIPADWQPGILATRDAVVAALAHAFPGATEGDDGVFEAADDHTEVLVGSEDPVDSINVTLWSGTDPETIGRVVAFAASLGTRALDIQSGEFLTAEGGAASYQDWDRYRARITGVGGDPGAE